MGIESEMEMTELKALYLNYLEAHKEYFQHRKEVTEQTGKYDEDWVGDRDEAYKCGMSLKTYLKGYFATLKDKQER